MNFIKSIDQLNEEYFSKIPDRNQIVFSNAETYSFNSTNFKQVKTLGSSQYVVKKYVHQPTRKSIAVKIIPVPRHNRRINLKQLGKILDEIRIFSRVSDAPAVLKFYGWTIDNENIRILMEPMKFSLRDFIHPSFHMLKNHHYYDYGVMDISMLSVMNGLIACGELGITHGDLKPDNILFSKRGDFKLSDFGEAKVLTDAYKPTGGSPAYWPPEKFVLNEGAQIDDEKSYVWALGIMLLEFITVDQPILALCGMKTIDELSKLVAFMTDTENLFESLGELISYVDRGPKSMYNSLLAIIEACLQPYEQRPTYKELLNNHEFQSIKSGYEGSYTNHVTLESKFLKDLFNDYERTYVLKEIKVNQVHIDGKFYFFSMHDFKIVKRKYSPNNERMLYFHSITKKYVSLIQQQIPCFNVTEIENLKKFQDSPHITTFHGCVLTFGRGSTCIEAMDLCLESLSYATKWKKFNWLEIPQDDVFLLPEAFIGHVIVVVLEVVKFLNAQGYAHGNLHPAAIHLRRDGVVKVSEFKDCWHIDKFIQCENDECEDYSLYWYYTNEKYPPPERVADEHVLDFRNDLWSLAVLLADVLLIPNSEDPLPFDSLNQIRYCSYGFKLYDLKNNNTDLPHCHNCKKVTFKSINKVRRKTHFCFNGNYSKDAYKFIMSCLKDLKKRPTLEELTELEFYKNHSNNFHEGRLAIAKYLEQIEEFDIDHVSIISL